MTPASLPGRPDPVNHEESQVYSSKNISAPIESLHAEILDLIFKFVTFKEFIVFDADGIFRLAAVVALSHVCHAWRERITSSPDLWTRLVIHFGSRPPPKDSVNPAVDMTPPPAVLASRNEYLNYVLAMSANRPLSLKLKMMFTFANTWDSRIFLASVVAHRERWLDLTVQLRLVPFLPLQTPMLRSLNIQTFTKLGVEASLRDPFIAFCRQALSLRSLSLDSSGCENLLSEGPWDQLQTLTGVCRIRWLATISPSLRQLRCLSISIKTPYVPMDGGDVMLEFRLLTTLTLSVYEEDTFSKVLSLLTVPSIFVLRIHGAHNVTPSLLVEGLQALLHRSSAPSIRDFEMLGCPFIEVHDPLPPALLVLFPNLETLRWGEDGSTILSPCPWSPFSPSLLKFLSETTCTNLSGTSNFPHPPRLQNFPLLRSLSLSWIMNCNDYALLDALETRVDPRFSSPSPALTHIEIATYTEDVEWSLERWQRLKRRGVTITVRQTACNFPIRHLTAQLPL